MKNNKHLIAGIRSQVNKDGCSTTVYTRNSCHTRQTSASQPQLTELAKIRKRNRLSEREKLVSILSEFGSDIPESLIQIKHGDDLWISQQPKQEKQLK